MARDGRVADTPSRDLRIHGPDQAVVEITAVQATVDSRRRMAGRFCRVHHRTPDRGTSEQSPQRRWVRDGVPHRRTTTGSQAQRPRRGGGTFHPVGKV
ncbi:hypothetical protein STRTUCAR8_02134 [Streptomyces turgidiscabies Car8]|uniref:Uncharacterized protein n=1 Tax=Streptomyces turgidiscabies (strain Car8) TaxID=698760 RepID=L7FH49_STRT8|nr:hypothetical protein STRTUCAR8_02134 [Streptomyces turgidiscabies Car8]